MLLLFASGEGPRRAPIGLQHNSKNMKQILFQSARGVSQPSAHLTTPPVRGAAGLVRCLAVVSAVAMLAAAGKAHAQLPPGWTDTDIGSPSQPGSASYSAGNWSVSGGGADIWNTADQFNFCYTNSTSYAVMIAQVRSVQAPDPWAKAGVMFRDDTTAGAMFATVEATSGNGVNFQWRNSTAGECGYSQVGGVNAPVWVKLVRNGNDFAGYYSPDDTAWLPIGPDQTIPMISAGLAGLAVTAHNDSALNTSTFR